MKELTPTQKKISLVLKLVVILSAVLGTFLSAYAGRRAFMGGRTVFMYFTIQSNIAIALICAVGCFLMLRGAKVSQALHVIKFVGTVAITLTGVVFVVLLAPTLGPLAWNVQNTLTHVVVPVAAVADFFVTSSGAGIPKKHVFYVTVPPLLYALYARIGYVLGWEFAEGIHYPYFFLNWGSPAGAFGFTKELPFMGCVWWILVLLLFLVAVGLGYLALAKALGKKRTDKKR
ncbi:MAG: Pr6Pr family membrane protein [Lachnospiraceae bacterium]|nr:Pr6Pr family membrane protein [Lachnospiraceae bacterium]